MTDIHAIIAAAKRRGGIADREPTFARSALYDHAIAMAEALARIADGVCYQEMPEIARECLDRIVKEANRG